MKSISPLRVLWFLLLVFALLGGIMLVFTYLFPSGIQVSETFSLRFPSVKEFFSKDTIQYADINTILHREKDTLLHKELNSLEDSLRAFREISRTNPSRLHYPKDDKSILHAFFDALESVEEQGSFLRILHYGDSQIEMDRITGYVREQLQQRFGGSGPGLQPAVQVIPSTAIRQISSGNWQRYACWGMDQSLRAAHRRYGVMLNFSEYQESASVTFNVSNQAYERARLISKVRVLIGNLESTAQVSLSTNNKGYGSKKAEPGGMQLLEWELDTFPKSITLQFSGGGSPEVYGIALDGKSGVAVDNMPMRGCSGTIFTRADSALLKKSFELLNVKLLILQFGGNMMPSINGEKSAMEYGEKFYEQIAWLKSLKKDLSVIVIGLADMSKRIDGKMQSYPHIEIVRDALKKATFDANGAYWDMLEVMGGVNSMPSWVEQGLAGGDYIHFTTKGAQKIAELFFEALINDYNEYRLEKRIKSLNEASAQ
jgi:lysophospholipase L1-like esterase